MDCVINEYVLVVKKQFQLDASFEHPHHMFGEK